MQTSHSVFDQVVSSKPTLPEEHASFDIFGYPFSMEIWAKKYSNNGKDESIYHTLRRVAAAIARVEPMQSEQAYWEQTFFNYMSEGIFMPAGRILAGAGTQNTVTLVNCFVNQTVPDSMEGIMESLSMAAFTMQQGGGVGTDFSTIRPEGSYLKRTGSEASGPMPFMDLWDAMCRTIMSAGSRRGAMMGTMFCTHPDLLKFITAKQTAGVLKNFNISVLVTDEFMRAVKNDADWDLHFHLPRADGKHVAVYEDGADDDLTLKKRYVYSRHKARDIWDLIMRSTYEYAEPGVIFIDTVNNENNLQYLETIACTNPCGEQPLPPHGACNLGAINLARMVKNAFKKDAEFDWNLFVSTITVAVRFLDNVIDATRYPLKEQEQEQKRKRRVGLGITGLADAMIQLGIHYGSRDAHAFVTEIGEFLANGAYQYSAYLAKLKGSFPGYAPEFLNSPMLKKLKPKVRDAIKTHGIRNGVLLTIAPVGTTSIVFGNVSSGLEPNFNFEYTRKVLEKDGTHSEHRVESFISRFAQHCRVETPYDPEYWTSTQELDVEAHIMIQAKLQRFIDASISKTINCPPDIAFEEFERLYTFAWDEGCKGCTTYRPSDVRGSILSTEPVGTAGQVESSVLVTGQLSADNITTSTWTQEPMKRPNILQGNTIKIKWPGISSAVYVTINTTDDGKPFELFFNSKDSTFQEWMQALSLTLTSMMRLGIDVTFVLKEFQQVVSATGSNWDDGVRFDSFIAFLGAKLDAVLNGHQPQKVSTEYAATGKTCFACGIGKMHMLGGCLTCDSCGYSKCG